MAVEPMGHEAEPGRDDAPSPLTAEGLAVGYPSRLVIEDLDIVIEPSSLTVIVGPNACGKSTLLRTLARVLTPQAGTVLLDGAELRSRSTNDIARRLGMLPQSSVAPEGITVTDLVCRGRYPHQSMLRQWSRADHAAVDRAMADAGVTELADRYVDELSGGQRQRVWIALVLAQETPVLLLDEPTTYLDIAHQVEVLELVDRLRRAGRTVVAVLHEINLAARYATQLVAMRDGRIVAQGPPDEVVTAAMVDEVFSLQARILRDPDTGHPVVLPRSSR